MDFLLEDYVKKENIYKDEPLAKHTCLRIGGPCTALVIVSSIKELSALVQKLYECKKPYLIIGNGSNVLAPDEGLDKIVIKLGGDFDSVSVSSDGTITAGAGALLSTIAKRALDNGLSGFEFASGIPGSLGGGLVMNAGAYGGELCQVTDQVLLMATEHIYFNIPVMKLSFLEDGTQTGEFVSEVSCGDVICLEGSRMEFAYRDSILKHHGLIALSAIIMLEAASKEDIQSKMDELNKARRDKQPLEYPSAGSTFKRPEGYFAAKLIEEAGLKGYRVGGAMVSTKHAGFCVNVDNATSKDFKKLIEDITAKVKENSGVLLEPEVIILDQEALEDRAARWLKESFS